jgi:pilus assembly protein CpaF
MVYERLDNSVDIDNDELWKVIEQCILEESHRCIIPVDRRQRVGEAVFNAMRRLDVLSDILTDDSITEIMINGMDSIFIERNGRIEKSEKIFESEQRLSDIAQKIAALSNKIVNASVPIVDTRLSDGSRVSIVLPPIALNGPVITIRKFFEIPLTIEKLIEIGSVTPEVAEFLKKAVRAKYNIFVSGGTGSGKTTFLNVLSNFIPKDERVITIEDSAELQLKNVENLVRLEARNANVEGKNAITIRDLIKASLRMRPDRIIVGEVRGEEALDMLHAMSTGHDGSLSTGHGNSPTEMMARLETMVLMGLDMPISAVRQQIAGAIDIIVHLGRLRDKTRRVLKIVEITGLEKGEIKYSTLYEFRETGERDGRVEGRLVKVSCGLKNVEKMQHAGYRDMDGTGAGDSGCGESAVL